MRKLSKKCQTYWERQVMSSFRSLFGEPRSRWVAFGTLLEAFGAPWFRLHRRLQGRNPNLAEMIRELWCWGFCGVERILLQTCCKTFCGACLDPWESCCKLVVFVAVGRVAFFTDWYFFLGSWISWLSDGGTQKTPAVWKCDGKRFSKLLDHGDVFVC